MSYIDREAAIEALNKMLIEDMKTYPMSANAEEKEFNFGMYQGETWAIKCVNALPPADVKPVIHAKWHDCYELIDGTFVGTCSACGKIKKSLYPVMDNYCAECGAIMDADMRGNAKCPKEE